MSEFWGINKNHKVYKDKLKKFNLSTGEIWYLQIKGKNEFFKARYLGLNEKTGELSFYNLNRGEQFEINSDQLISFVSFNNDVAKGEKFSEFYRTFLDLQKIGEAFLLPHKKLARNNSVEVVGKTIRSEKKTAVKILNQVIEFDNLVSELGFNGHHKTVLVLNDEPFFKPHEGAHYFNFNVWNPWFGGRVRFIYLNSYGKKGFKENHASVVWHERAHSMLHSHYSSKSFINFELMTQEGIADFLTFYVSSSPIIGNDYIQKGRFIRNIQTQQNVELKQIHHFTDVTEDFHSNSLFVSNLLWAIYGDMEKNEFKNYFLNFLENLNTHFSSYAKMLNSVESFREEDDISVRVRILEYVFTIAYKTAYEQKANVKLLSTIQTKIEKAGFSMERVFAIQSHLGDDGIDYKVDKPQMSSSWLEYFFDVNGGLYIISAEALFVGMGAYELTQKILEWKNEK